MKASFLKELWRRLQWFIHRAEFDRDMEEEMRHHLALKAEEQGDADAARRQFGNITSLKEKSRAIWTWTFAEQLAQDVRYASRAMWANKLFTSLAIVSLALGIGANTAVYSFMDAILIRAMPVKHPEQLVILNWRAGKGGSEVVQDHTGSSYTEPGGGETSPNYPYRAYGFLRENNHVLSTLFGYANAGRLNLVIDGQAELGDSQYVSGDYFSGLGVGAAAGRLIGPEDDRPSAPPVVTISYNFWQQRYGASRDVIGRTVLINGKPFTICGVSAPEFFGVEPQNAPVLFIPIQDIPLVDLRPYITAQTLFISEHSYWIEMMGRLGPGVTLQQAQAELAAQFHQWVSQTAKTEKERSTLPKLWLQEGKSGVDSLRRQYSKSLFVLMTAVSLILAIACANLANLLLARAASRRREIAVRLSLGAGRLRIIRQLLTESVLLSLCGGLLAIFVALAGIRSLTLLLGNGNPNFTLRADLDWRVLAFTFAVTVAAGLLFGTAPAIQATRVDVAPSLKEARISDIGRKRFGFRLSASNLLVTFQIAVSLLLVTAAGLFVRTLQNLHSVNLGFNSDKLLVFNLNALQAGYKDATLTTFYAELQRRFALIPGVRSATLTELPLVANSSDSTRVTIPGLPVDAAKPLGTSYARVGPRFFETMQIPILAGRAIDERDNANAPVTVVVNEVFVKKYFAGLWPIGRHFQFGGRAFAVDVEIVGVARTARYNSLTREIPPVVYLSYLQAPKTRPVQHAYFVLRTTGDPLALANTVRRIVHEVGPQVPIANMTTESKIIDQTIVNQRIFADLCTGFGLLALIMACVGLYATQAYAVTRRTSEIGIRMALGAERRRIIWMVLREVLVLSSAGVLIGLCAFWQTTTVLESFLFGLKAHDAASFEAAAAILLLCAILAAYAPARRASRIDPMVALRHE